MLLWGYATFATAPATVRAATATIATIRQNPSIFAGLGPLRFPKIRKNSPLRSATIRAYNACGQLYSAIT